MSAEGESEARAPAPRRPRRLLPYALVAVASLLAFLAVFALWANRQLLNTDNWTDTSSELLENDAIRGQVAVYMTDQLYANVDVQGRLREALPPRADALAGPIAGGLRTLVERRLDVFLGRPRPQHAWEQANRQAHERFLDIVEGGGDVVSTQGGVVTLNLKTLLEQSQGQLGVGERLAEKLPASAGSLTIMRSDQLELAQDGVHVLKALPIVLIVLVLGLYALAVYLAAGRRRETLRACGIGLAVAGGGALAARSLGGDAVVNSLATTDSVKPAVEATWDISTSLLQEAAAATLAYGLVIVFAAWLAGPTRLAVGTRRALAPYLREARYAYGITAVIVLVILAWGPTPATRKLLPALMLTALLVLGVELLRRQTAREHPDASIEESTQRMRERVGAMGERVRGGVRRSSGQSAGEERLDELERLAKLRDAGVLDSAEFDREKERILGAAPAASDGTP